MENAPRPLWKTCLGIGCVVLLLGAFAVGVFVAMNWTKIREGASELSGTVSDLLAVRTAVQAHTKTSEVGVHRIEGSGDQGDTLSIEIADSDLFGLSDESDPEARRRALEIAVVARDALPPEKTPAKYRIVFASRMKVGVTITQTRSHEFPASELPPPAPR